MKTFRDYLLVKDLYKEEVGKPKGDGSSDKKSSSGQLMTKKSQLGETEDGPQPITIGTGKDQHPNLAVLIKAFDEPVEFGPQQIDKAGGTKKNEIKGKKLYLVGGALRDTIRGETPKDYDIATDATVDEIRLILTNYGFSELAPKAKMGGKEGHDVDHSKYAHLTKTSKNPYTFAILGTDMNDQEMVVQVVINGQDFELATFREDAKTDGRATTAKLTGDIRKDAERRDFTMNAMHLGPLKIGDNKDVSDFFGGVDDAVKGRVRWVGNAKERLEEDQLRALRYLRFKGRLDDRETTEQDKKAIQAIAGLPRLQPYEDDAGQYRDPRPRIQQEFRKALEQAKDPAWLFELADELGLLPTVFPKLKFTHNPLHGEDDEGKVDKHIALASLLADNTPEEIDTALKGMHWPHDEVERVRFLIDFFNKFHPEMDDMELHKYAERLRGKTGKKGQAMFSTGYLRGNKSRNTSNLMKWAKLMSGREGFQDKRGMAPEDFQRGVDAFLHNASLEGISVSQDDPDFAQFFDPVSGRVKPDRRIGGLKARKEKERFRGLYDERMPKNVQAPPTE